MTACATTPKDSGPSYPWPHLEQTTIPAPIIVRSATILSTMGDEHNRAHEALANAGYAFLAGGRVGPLGLVIAVPLAIGGAVYALTSQDQQHCAPGAKSALGELPQWTRSTFGSMPVVDVVADAARRQLRGVGGPAVLASNTGTSPEERAREVTTVGARAGVSTVILADVYVEFGEVLECRTKLAARAEVRVQPLGQPEMTAPRSSLWAEQWDVPLQDWAKNPERATEALTLLLDQLGGKLIDSYRFRMGCSDTECGW